MASLQIIELTFDATPDPADNIETQKGASPNNSRFTNISLLVGCVFPAVLQATGNRATVGQFGSVQKAVTVDASALTTLADVIAWAQALQGAMQTAFQMV